MTLKGGSIPVGRCQGWGVGFGTSLHVIRGCQCEAFKLSGRCRGRVLRGRRASQDQAEVCIFLAVVNTEGQGVITVRVLSGLLVCLQCRDSWSEWTKCNGVVWSGWIRELSWGPPGGHYLHVLASLWDHTLRTVIVGRHSRIRYGITGYSVQNKAKYYSQWRRNCGGHEAALSGLLHDDDADQPLARSLGRPP